MQTAQAFPQSVGFDPIGPDSTLPSARFVEFQRLLTEALQERGISIHPDSANRLGVALAVRPASLGVAINRAGTLDPLSPPRRHHFYDACNAQRLDAAIILRDAVSGAVTARWRGGFDDCRIGDTQLANLAEQFARNLTGR